MCLPYILSAQQTERVSGLWESFDHIYLCVCACVFESEREKFGDLMIIISVFQIFQAGINAYRSQPLPCILDKTVIFFSEVFSSVCNFMQFSIIP